MKAAPLLLLVVVFSVEAAGSGRSGANTSVGKSTGTALVAGGTMRSGGGAGGSTAGRRTDPRNVPPLAEDRKINEQDCSRPVDWTAGNLKCK